MIRAALVLQAAFAARPTCVREATLPGRGGVGQRCLAAGIIDAADAYATTCDDAVGRPGAAAGRNSCPFLRASRGRAPPAYVLQEEAPAVQCCKNRWKRSRSLVCEGTGAAPCACCKRPRSNATVATTRRCAETVPRTSKVAVFTVSTGGYDAALDGAVAENAFKVSFSFARGSVGRACC